MGNAGLWTLMFMIWENVLDHVPADLSAESDGCCSSALACQRQANLNISVQAGGTNWNLKHFTMHFVYT